MFGKPGGGPVDLANLGDGGFRIVGVRAFDRSGNGVSGAGDVNGDGLADSIVGAPSANPGGAPGAGEAYVVFGKTDGNPVDLANLGSGGFRIGGAEAGDRLGASVSGAGDVDGDGLADLIIGAPGGEPDGNENAGESYVVFGKTDSDSVDIANLGGGGFRIDGIDPDDSSGVSVSGAGDVNGDGLADVIVGAIFGDPGGNEDAGESYVVFGKSGTDSVDLASLGDGGFQIDGIDANDQSGSSVSGAGDVNGDGLADLIVGAGEADPFGRTSAGESYVVFGKPDNNPVDLASLGSGGFRIDGAKGGHRAGRSVSGAGDVNADGLSDLIVGANFANFTGQSWVVLGKVDSNPVDLANLGEGGFRIDGIDLGDNLGISVSGAGDVNGDGLSDVIVGAYLAAPAGESYVVFGPYPVLEPEFFTDRGEFLARTDATAGSAPHSPAFQPPEPFETGQVVLDAIEPSSLYFADFPADFPGDNDVELAINGKEDIDIAMADGYVYAMGVDFDDASGGDTPSTFEVRLIAGQSTLASFQFETEVNPDQDYIGVWSRVPFDRLQIRETTTANENEFFGTVSIGRVPRFLPIFEDGFEPVD